MNHDPDEKRWLEDDLDAENAEIMRWWADTVAKDATDALAKRKEYGSADLEIMGEAMLGMTGFGVGGDADERRRGGIEMALAYYTLGKISRAFGAYARGELPSDDTWRDLSTYAMMARRVREHGSW